MKLLRQTRIEVVIRKKLICLLSIYSRNNLTEIQTVVGEISGADLGITLPHEHILLNLACYLKKSNNRNRRYILDKPISLEILGDVRKDSEASRDNLILNEKDSLSELNFFKDQGGKTIIDVTPVGIGRDPISLQRISKKVGINIVCGTGWYIGKAHPKSIKRYDIEDLADLMEREITQGIENSHIKAGVIGEIGCSDPLTRDEKKILRASARAQLRTNVPIVLHPALYNLKSKLIPKKASEYLSILDKEGVNFNKVYLSHMNWTCEDLEYHRSVIEKYDVRICYDGFRSETWNDSLFPGFGPYCDKFETRAISQLVKEGYQDNLLISSDICMKIHLRKYGGYGYAHILENVIPLLKYFGLTNKQIRHLIVDNPRRIFS